MSRGDNSGLGGFAVNAGANGLGGGAAFMAKPRRNDRPEAAGRSARRDDQQLLRRFESGINRISAIAHHRGLADLGPFPAMDPGALENASGDLGFAPTGGYQMVAQLRWNDDHIVTRPDRIMPHV